MNIKIGINGFGRIGRMVMRASLQYDDLQICAINDLVDESYLAYLLKHDSSHGTLPQNIVASKNKIQIGDREIETTKERDPTKLGWDKKGVDYIVESTGFFTKYDAAKMHLDAGAKKVIISAPSDTAPMYVMGVNHDKYESSQDIVSNASCTTNCLAPIAYVLHKNWEITQAFMSTIHASTINQNTVDGPSGRDKRIGRSVFNNIIPASTGAASAVSHIIPELKSKITGMAFRVPVANVSVVDLTCSLKQATNYEAIVEKMKEASNTYLKGILDYTDEDLVSSDFSDNPHTSIFDAKASMQLNEHFFKIISWYDNEWGYACKILELIRHMHSVEYKS